MARTKMFENIFKKYFWRPSQRMRMHWFFEATLVTLAFNSWGRSNIETGSGQQLIVLNVLEHGNQTVSRPRFKQRYS
jgi:hypothetical protein